MFHSTKIYMRHQNKNLKVMFKSLVFVIDTSRASSPTILCPIPTKNILTDGDSSLRICKGQKLRRGGMKLRFQHLDYSSGCSSGNSKQTNIPSSQQYILLSKFCPAYSSSYRSLLNQAFMCVWLPKLWSSV